MIILDFILLLFTFYALAKLIDLFFVETLEIISKKLKLSSDVAGATFMAIGSSAPELFVSILALTKVNEQQSLGAGTIVGSAIFNILVIIGASALFKRALLTWQPVIRDMTFYILTIFMLLFTFIDGKITFIDSALFIGLYILYIFSLNFWKKLFPYTSKDDILNTLAEEKETRNIRKENWSIKNIFDKALTTVFFDLEKKPKLYLINFFISILLLAILSHYMVEAAVNIAIFFKIPSVIIGLTILAAGTSIPDLLASINVAKKGKGDMAIANAVGSNIFDIAIGLGLPWFFLTLITGKNIVVVTENLSSSITLLFATVVALLFLLLAKKWEIGRYAGILLIASYIFYILTQLGIVSFSICLNLAGSHCFGL
ncbi:MAG: calcium/sodium antiporter [Candidatus Pacebacteria bacterium]|nr:calcium/sodium antiporter [Candidatus Paceibacterota bacterium]